MKTPFAFLPLFVLLACLTCLPANAQTNGTWTTNSTGGFGNSGNWSDSTKWTATGVPSGGGNATFGAYDNARSVALDGDYTIGALTIIPRSSGFNSTTFALTGTNTLTINSGLVIGGGASISIAPNLNIAADQTWTTLGETGVAPTTLSGNVTGVGKITRTANGANTSAGIVNFNGVNTFSGGFEQNAALSTTRLGSSSVVSGGQISSGPLGTGTVTLNAGNLGSNSTTARSISNNVVVGGNISIGNTTNNGALTFSDVGLTTASTFTLANAANGGVTVLRSLNTAITFDQRIAESGGANQSVNFASVSGTPTVTLNRTKTAGGNLLSGGVNLVLNNGAANSGAILAVNGSVSATGANKFSSGALISDGANLIATDASSYSEIAGDRATVYNNARVSFATDQTQATLAGLFTADSQFRLGLGSGSGNATVTENYNQSALGNGRAGLVSASTGIITYTGTLTAGSDNTYRVGGGLGTLALGSALTGGNALRVEGGGIVTSTVNHTYNGTTTLVGPAGYTGSSALTTGLVTLSGANGAFSGTSGVTLNSGAILNLEVGGTGNNRINNSASITLNSGYMLFNNSGNNTAFSETMGDFVVNAGANQINFRTTPAANTVRTVQFGTLTRNNNAVLLVRGDALGGTGTARNEIKFSNSPTLIGGGGAAGTTNQSIVPWMRGAFDGAIGSGPGRFATYDANGLRTLNPGTEMVQANATTQIDTAIGSNTDRNVRWNPNAAGNANLLATASNTITVNSLWIGNSGTNAATTYSLNSGTINVTSGAVHFQHDASQNFTVNGGTLAFGSAEAVVTSNSVGGFLTTLSANMTGSGGLSIYALNGGGISLGGSNSISGNFTFGGNGFVAVDQDARFGNAANALVHGGGELRFFAGFTSTRAVNLLGDVGDNTFGNNNSSGQTVVWNGDISGAGRLRLINNNGSNGVNGFNLGGNNTYSGGTQIEGILVSATSNTALGTGTVTLIGANTNAASLNVTAAAGTLGGLRGTDGTVTINPTASAATLTVGSNNENTVFNGVIAQGAGKTGSFTKVGNGTLVLGGSNTYTGTTTVNAGTLLVNGSLANSALNVESGGALGGSGYIAGTTTIQSGGTLSPGNSPGIQNFANLALNAGSFFKFELAANSTSGRGTNFDGVNILAGGALTIQSGALSNLVFNASGSTVNWSDSLWDSDQAWLVFDLADGGYAGNLLAINSLTADSQGQSLGSIRAGASFSYAISGGDVYLNYTAIPEPSTGMLLMIGLTAAVCLHRRSRRIA